MALLKRICLLLGTAEQYVLRAYFLGRRVNEGLWIVIVVWQIKIYWDLFCQFSN